MKADLSVETSIHINISTVIIISMFYIIIYLFNYLIN